MKIQNLKKTISHGLTIRKLLNRLSRYGISITPYCVVREEENQSSTSPATDTFQSYKATFISSSDLAEAHLIGDDNGKLLKDLEQRMLNGHLCFAIKHEQKYIARMWCDLQEFNFPPCEFSLKSNESYLYAAEIATDYRGRGIAPFMRSQCYKALGNLGRDINYSYTEYFNTPAMRFKEKLGATRLALYVHIDLFGKFSINWRLKTYTDLPSQLR